MGGFLADSAISGSVRREIFSHKSRPKPSFMGQFARHRPCLTDGMAAKCFEELIAWQLCVELREAVFTAIESGRAAQDGDFCQQIRDSARSAPRNLAEGFDKFAPREFARFARIARGSLGETRNHILDARARAYFTGEQAENLLSLQRRAHIATTRLLAYLESCNGVSPAGWSSPKRKR